MKTLLALLLCVPLLAHAGSWFEFEAGIGVGRSSDMGDGIWIQKGAPDNRERLTTPAYLAGLTGDIGSHLSWHADYVYFGTLRASVNGVPDANYNPVTHKVHDFTNRYSPFNGQGHTQGIALTLEPHTDYSGWRFSDNLDASGFLSAVPGQRVYVTSESEDRTYSALAGADGTLSDLRVFADRGGESVAVDGRGNVYVANGQIFVYGPAGGQIGRIDIPERPIDIVFGGADRRTLFILAHHALFSAKIRDLK